MFTIMPLIAKSVDDYVEHIPPSDVEELRQLAQPLAPYRVLHLSTTAYGTSVAEMLSSAVPLAGGLGLRWEWEVIAISEEFWRVTTAIYRALSGAGSHWDASMVGTWHNYSRLAAMMFDQDYDFVVVHDPQALMLLQALTAQRGARPPGRWVWHCHLDLSGAQREVCDLLGPCFGLYDCLVESGAGFMDTACTIGGRILVPPAIDPMAPKNVALRSDTVSMVQARHSIDPERPLIVQVSHLDRWNDPLGLVAAYRLAKRDVPELQLALVPTELSEYATSGEAADYYQQLADEAAADKDIHIPRDPAEVGALEINASQRMATVVVQRSIRGGYSFSVAEAMWKERPVIATSAGQMALQVLDGVTGYLVGSNEECAARIVELVRQPELARRYGQAGHEHVRRNFMVTRWLHDYLALLGRLL